MELLRQISRLTFVVISSVTSLALIRWSSVEHYGLFAKVFLLITVINSLRDLGLQSNFYYNYSKVETIGRRNADVAVVLMFFLLLVSLFLLFLISFFLEFDLLYCFFLTSFVTIPFCQVLLNILSDYFGKSKLSVLFNCYFTAITVLSFFAAINNAADCVMAFYSFYIFIASLPAIIYSIYVFLTEYKLDMVGIRSVGLSNAIRIVRSYSIANLSYAIYQRLVPFLISCFLNNSQAALFSIIVRAINLLNEPVSIYFSGRGAKILFDDFLKYKWFNELVALYSFYFLSSLIFFGFMFSELLSVFYKGDLTVFKYLVFSTFIGCLFRAFNAFASYSLMALSYINALSKIRFFIALLFLGFIFCFYSDGVLQYSLIYIAVIEVSIFLMKMPYIVKGIRN